MKSAKNKENEELKVNQFKPKEAERKEEKEPVKEKKRARPNKVARSFISVLNGSFLIKGNVADYMPYIFFLTFLGICYIGNGYYAEDTVRAINNVGNELKELRSEYITTKSELMFKSKQSEVAKALETTGVKESVVPPKKIVIKEQN